MFTKLKWNVNRCNCLTTSGPLARTTLSSKVYPVILQHVSAGDRRVLGDARTAIEVWKGLPEEKALADPTVRAVRLVERWDAIAKDFQDTGRDRYGAVRPEMAATLREFSKAIIKDPDAATIMHERPGQIGINPGGTLSRAAASPNVGMTFAAIVESIIEPPSRSISYSR